MPHEERETASSSAPRSTPSKSARRDKFEDRPIVNASVVQFENAGLGRALHQTERITVGFVSNVRRRKNQSQPTGDASEAEKNDLLKPLRPASVKSHVASSAIYEPAFPKYCFDASTYHSFLRESSRVGASITDLPKPKHALRTKELPYVYRYKIQKGIVMLSRMVPSKPPNRPDHIW